MLVTGTMLSGLPTRSEKLSHSWQGKLLLSIKVLQVLLLSCGSFKCFKHIQLSYRRISWNSSYKEARPGMKDCSKPAVQLRTVAERTGICLPAVSHRLRSAGISSSEKTKYLLLQDVWVAYQMNSLGRLEGLRTKRLKALQHWARKSCYASNGFSTLFLGLRFLNNFGWKKFGSATQISLHFQE